MEGGIITGITATFGFDLVRNSDDWRIEGSSEMILLGRGIGINPQGTYASWVIIRVWWLLVILMVRLVVSKACLERDYAKANDCSGETGRSLRYKRAMDAGVQ